MAPWVMLGIAASTSLRPLLGSRPPGSTPTAGCASFPSQTIDPPCSVPCFRSAAQQTLGLQQKDCGRKSTKRVIYLPKQMVCLWRLTARSDGERVDMNLSINQRAGSKLATHLEIAFLGAEIHLVKNSCGCIRDERSCRSKWHNFSTGAKQAISQASIGSPGETCCPVNSFTMSILCCPPLPNTNPVGYYLCTWTNIQGVYTSFRSQLSSRIVFVC